jgi:NAD dependent epimerase/dehydratase family enzyme
MPWVHRDDVIGSILFVLKNQNLSGAVNVTSPRPVKMKEFGKELGGILKRPSWIPIPAFVLKILLGEMSEMVLTGQKALPQKLIEAGYKFKFPELQGALKEILG